MAPPTTRLCDRCGRILPHGALRYVARVEIFAAADPLEITAADLARDPRLQIEHHLEQAEAMTEAQLMRDVHVAWTFDLCRRCQLEVVVQPLGVPLATPPPPARDRD